MLRYPAKIQPDTVGFMVSFRDIPEALSAGDTREHAESQAADALLAAMDFYFEDRRVVPSPSAPKKGELMISLPASVSAKVLVLNQMIQQHVAPGELARRMGSRKKDVNRIIDLGHTTKIDTIAAALASLGSELELSVRQTLNEKKFGSKGTAKKNASSPIPADGTIPHEVIELMTENGWSIVRAWREYLGITQADMAARLNIQHPSYLAMEAPDARPRRATRERLAEALGVQYDQLNV